MPKSTKATFSFLPLRNTAITIFVLIGFTVTLTACAAIQNRDAIEIERVLAASGFQMGLADTPQKHVHIKSVPQRKLVLHQHDDKIYYVYADATSCKCLYVGNEKAYQRYQRLSIEKNIAENQRMAAEINENASMNWGMWGPWGLGVRPVPGSSRGCPPSDKVFDRLQGT